MFELGEKLFAALPPSPAGPKRSALSTPHRCPVCNGKGIVPNGFFKVTTPTWATSSANPDECRPCKGAGVLWS